MPIKVDAIQWEQSAEEVTVVVPLKGVRSSKADIYSSDLYIKVNFPPYLFEADLFAEIDELASKATLGAGTVRFDLKKKAVGQEWPTLVIPKEVPSATRLERRLQSQERARRRTQEELDRQKEDQDEARKQALRKQMELEEKERQRIEELKAAERVRATQEVERLQKSSVQATTRPLFEDDDAGAAIRPSGKISVTFTPRAFPTPLRESKAIEEEEWLAKQTAARQAVHEAKAAQSGSVEEDPIWYKDKGSSFFKAGNYEAAINAYTAALALDAKMPVLYSNRAACHLKLGDAGACAQDCAAALDLLQPPVPANAQLRLKVRCRRAAALSALGDLSSAESDLEEALRISPGNEGLLADLQRLRQARISGHVE